MTESDRPHFNKNNRESIVRRENTLNTLKNSITSMSMEDSHEEIPIEELRSPK